MREPAKKARDDLQAYMKEYEPYDDAWLLQNCRKVTGRRRMAIFTILVNRGYTAKDLEAPEP